jgi:hypothetical protein
MKLGCSWRLKLVMLGALVGQSAASAIAQNILS